ncbi:MAG: hypothetical protein HXY34_12495 [Candidatus Thorarchaeota archaeon]|nr:hypothetical protein [Candidatus Thorarchaeota archaeon]
MSTVPAESPHARYQLIDTLLTRPPPGYVFVVMVSQDSHFDLFMHTIVRRSIELGMKTLQVVTEARNRSIMRAMAQNQGERFQILEVSYGQELLGVHSCSRHLHEINIMLREMRSTYAPRVVSFEGLTPLLIDFSPKDVVQFFKESVEESVKAGSLEFYLIHEDAADKVTINQIFSLAQGIITLTTSKGKYYLEVKKSSGLDLKMSSVEYVPSMPDNDRTEWGIMVSW